MYIRRRGPNRGRCCDRPTHSEREKRVEGNTLEGAANEEKEEDEDEEEDEVEDEDKRERRERRGRWQCVYARTRAKPDIVVVVIVVCSPTSAYRPPSIYGGEEMRARSRW